jgi:hypothetical protein
MPGKFEEASLRTKKGVNTTYHDEYVRVKESEYLKKLNLTGNGLYAERVFNKGDVIMEYLGKIISDKAAEAMTVHRKYLFDVKKGKKVIHVIDANNNLVASAIKFVNTVQDWYDQARNSHFVQWNKKIYLVASKRITKGKEFLAYYGPDTDRIIAAN